MSDDKKNVYKTAKPRTTRAMSADITKRKPSSRATSSGQPPTVFRVSGHITHRDTKSGLPGLRVEAIDKDPHCDQPLGGATTDAEGRYEISFPSRKVGKGEKGGPDIVVRVSDQKGAALGESAMYRNASTEVKIDLAVTLISGSVHAPDLTIIELMANRKRILSDATLELLRKYGVSTFSDLRRQGGLMIDAATETGVHFREVSLLNSATTLSALELPVDIALTLAENGVCDIRALSLVPLETLTKLIGNSVAADAITRIQLQAVIAEAGIANMLVSLRLGSFASKGRQISEFSDIIQLNCQCDCASATSAQAYLAHLLRFAISAVRYNSAPIDLGVLKAKLLQPFADLPATCESAEKEVAQARIAIEVLRKLLNNRSSVNWYLEAAYVGLLEFVGLSYDEIRQAHALPTVRKKARFIQSKHLGVGDDSSDAQLVDELYRDIAAPASAALAISEDYLHVMFGFRSTLLEPTEPDEVVPHALRFRQEALRADWWRTDNSITRPLIELPVVDPHLVDDVDIVDRVDAVPRPADLTWWRPIDFLRRRQEEWSALEHEMARYFTPTVGTTPADQLKMMFAEWSQPVFAIFLPNSQIPLPPFGFRIGNQSLDFQRLKTIYDLIAAGGDASADLTLFSIEPITVRVIVDYVSYVERGRPVTADETHTFKRTIQSYIKRVGFRPHWIDQEKQNTSAGGQVYLNPQQFRNRLRSGDSADPDWTPRPGLGDAQERWRWEDVQHSRSGQFDELRDDLRRIVVKLEERLLTQLRNQLIAATPPGSIYTKQKAERLTDRFQLDFEAGDCQRTTRVTQAITTVQGVLVGIRDGLLEDRLWSLVEPDFDQIWAWLGTYESWRAAITAFLYPERLVRPSLRRDMSPGFGEALQVLRDSDPITTVDAARAHNAYANYLNDIASLEVMASASRMLVTGSGGVERTAVYLLGRPLTKKSVYWSVALEQFDSQGDQSWWRPIPTMKDVDAVYGCALCGKFLVAVTGSRQAGGKRLELWRQALADTSLRPANLLAEDAPWEGPFQLDLPADAHTYDSIAIRPGAGDGQPSIVIEADEETIYSRPIAEDATAWSGRFTKRLNTRLWQELGEAGFPVANRATFACHGFGLSTNDAVNNPELVLAADVDGDGADEFIAFKNGDGFWTMKLSTIGSRLRWLPLGNRGSRLLDCEIPSVKYLPDQQGEIVFSVAGDFDGDGIKEIAAITNAQTQTDLNFDLFVRKWHAGEGQWRPLGQVGQSGSELRYTHHWQKPHQCLVGRFTQSVRDELLVTFEDLNHRNNAVKQLVIFGLVANNWTSVVITDVSSFAGVGYSFGRGCVGHFSGQAKHELLFRQVNPAGVESSVFWTLFYTGGTWSKLPDLDVSTISVDPRITRFPRMLAADLDDDGNDELVFADGGPLVRFFRFEGSAWSSGPVGTVTLGSPAIRLVVGDFEGTGLRQIVADTDDNAGHLIRWNLNNDMPELVNQAVDLNLSTRFLIRGLVSGRFTDRAQTTALAALGDGSTTYVSSKQPRQLATTSKPNVTRIKPSINSPYALIEVLYASTGASRLKEPDAVAATSSVAFLANVSNRPRNQAYLEEGFYFLIVEIALRLQIAGNYSSALQWFQLITKLGGARLESASKFLDWDIQGNLAPSDPVDLQDPLDPHGLARRRAGTYYRFTLEAMIRLLCEYGDAQFSLANAESLPRARELYLSALALLQSHSYASNMNACTSLIESAISLLSADPALSTLIPEVRTALEATNDVLEVNRITAEIRQILASISQTVDAIAKIRLLLNQSASKQNEVRTIAHVVQSEDASSQTIALRLIAKQGFNKHIAKFGALDLEEMRDIIRGRRTTPMPQYTYCVPPSSSLMELKRRIELCLFRLRNCMDIAGNELFVAPLGSESTASVANLAQASMVLQPLPYRYATLLERAKQLIELARQLESSMLGFIETSERKRYEVLNARRDLALASTSQQLRTVQVQQAVEEVGLATLQRDKSQDQINRFRSLIRDGLSAWEEAGLKSQWGSFGLKQLATISTVVEQTGVGGWVDFFTSWGAKNTIAVASSQAAALDTLAQAQFSHAQFERRAEGWQISVEDATRDREIGQEQIHINTIRLHGAEIEREISALQVQYSTDAVSLLVQKSFANEALYEWMAVVLQGVYRFFLKQATQMARLAELQLAFERQEAPVGFVKPDYWSPQRSDTTPDVGTRVNSVDSVRGLTGAARLLRDIYQLDQNAFTKNKRKQQMTEVVSLVRHDPLAFEQLRNTGRVVFDTPMTLFESRSPGNYLRLIHRVRLSVVALVPPNQGIRATLLNSGISEVVVPQDGGFKSVKLQRGFEQITFSSPSSSAGQFELDAQPEMLAPFEGGGVASRWILDMPLPANRFDPSSLADVVMTIEYTALYDSYLRAKTIKELPRELGGERVFSMRNEFPDAWYDLHNPDQDSSPLEVEFSVMRTDFPPTLERIRMRQVILKVLSKVGRPVGSIEVAFLGFAMAGASTFVGGGAITDLNGIASTRRASGANWLPIVDLPAVDGNVAGRWKIRFPLSSRRLFDGDVFEDILLTVSFVGEQPPWP